MSTNFVLLIGRLGQDPETKYLDDAKVVTKFSLAVNRPTKNKQTDWFSCEAWAKTAETITNYCKKGSQVSVQGRLQIDKWEKDGEKRTATKVIVERVELLGSKNDNQQPESVDDFGQPVDRPTSTGKTQTTRKPQNDFVEDSSYEDLPF